MSHDAVAEAVAEQLLDGTRADARWVSGVSNARSSISAGDVERAVAKLRSERDESTIDAAKRAAAFSRSLPARVRRHPLVVHMTAAVAVGVPLHPSQAQAIP